MHVKKDCRYFSWKKEVFVLSMNKVDRSILYIPSCEKGLINPSGCPDRCRFYKRK